jgi:hypothetical protein
MISSLQDECEAFVKFPSVGGASVNAVDQRGGSWKLKVKNEKVKVGQMIVSITDRRIPLAKLLVFNF